MSCLREELARTQFPHMALKTLALFARSQDVFQKIPLKSLGQRL
ncbi:hypothetical protein KIPB_006366, partial [Kipferlia bialata]|eukprot:g6366.t1